ncbi:MAG: hypothetical protein AUH92_01440 [Acidobacteria bacterium 13_1_40CM_4_69_4]|nr:MAG: hypothetical protein AUH92_01440 [Acidobacteria bacterium 13_1_40CM_4_69_4]
MAPNTDSMALSISHSRLAASMRCTAGGGNSTWLGTKPRWWSRKAWSIRSNHSRTSGKCGQRSASIPAYCAPSPGNRKASPAPGKRRSSK